ncbi:aminopeptidase N-like [Temnothorax americanus]|uniref:aminopeptidase N-like n=1 Tax=Temnothorax americanus TaxID=1964332 RepID=UPI0040676AFD
MEFPKLLLHIGLILATVTDLCVADDPNPKHIHRLPINSAPFDYNLSLIIPDLEKSNTFHGEARVTVTIFRDSFNISLHSQGLEINKTATTLTASMLKNGTITYKPTEHTYDHETNILSLHFKRQLYRGSYILNMKFAGNFSQTDFLGSSGGFIKIPYTDENENKRITYNRTLAATYLRPNKARRMFPCWDEPAINAYFYISVMHHQKYTVLSNWPIREQYNVENDMKWTHFDRTNLVSAYLVGIVIVSDFVPVNNADQSVNVWCRSSLTSSATFVQSIAERVTPLLEEYTNITKGVPKIDHVMVPDYPNASMGDWGIIIYHESQVVYDKGKDPTFRRREVASLVAYEIVHQWFGNFITPLWWTDIWLNEGFAVYFQAYFLDKFTVGYKNSRSIDLFVTGAMHHALYRDADGLLGSVTLNLYDNDTLDNQLFVDPVREKAPAILRMLHHAMGDNVFQRGITKYFATKQYSAVTPDDFWRAIQSAKDERTYPPRDSYFFKVRIKEVMDMWIVQNRYPVLNVTMNYETGNYKTGELVITQNCFHATEGTNNKWWIPITFTDESRLNFSNTMPILWLEPDKTLRVPINTLGWIIVNLQQTAYCRVYYDTRIYERIIPYLSSQHHTKIHVLNRAQIIDDAYAFLLEDQLESTIFFYLINYYKFERDYVAWRPMFRILERNEKYFSLPESKGFKLYMVEIFYGVLRYVGYEENPDDDDLTKLLRLEATKWACTVGQEDCKRRAAVKLSEHLADPDTHKVPRWWQDWTYCFGLAVANKTTWDKMMKRYQITAPNDNLLKYLNCAENPDIIINYLNITASDTKLFKDLDQIFIFNLILEKHARNDLVLDYILANLDDIKPRLFPATEAIYQIHQNVYSNEQLSKVNTFVGKYFRRDRDALARYTFLIEKRRNKLKASVDIFTKRFGESQTLIDQLPKKVDEEDVNIGLVTQDIVEATLTMDQDLSA